MANQWFRLYAEFSTDPKVQMLSEQDQRRLVMLFCMRCNVSETLLDKHVTFHLRISDEEWTKTKAVFVSSGFIDSDNKVLNWDKRQYVSDSSTARVTKYRDKKKRYNETQGNVTVTPPEQNRTEHNRTNKSVILLPEWLPETSLNDFKSHRSKLKKPMTDRAVQLLITELTKLKDDGYDPIECLNTAMLKGWQTPYAPKEKPKNKVFNMDEFLKEKNGQ